MTSDAASVNQSSLASPVDSSENAVSSPRVPASWRCQSRRAVLLLLGIYLGCCVMLGMIQRKLIYLPTREAPLLGSHWGLPDSRCRSVSLVSQDGLTLQGWHVLPPGSSALNEEERLWELRQGRPVILYFSGNAGHRGDRAYDLNLLGSLNADVFLFDYRGYGDNPGVPSEAALVADAQAIWRYLVETEGVESGRILLYGESLGGGVACALAAHLAEQGITPGGLFLKTTFSSLGDVAAFHYRWLPTGLLLRERYPSVQRISQIKCPIAILHGRQDEIVPFQLAEKLFEAAPDRSASGIPKRFFELPEAGHNDVLDKDPLTFRNAVGELLDHIRLRP